MGCAESHQTHEQAEFASLLVNMPYIEPLIGDMSDLDLKNFSQNLKKDNVILVMEVRGGLDKKPKGKGHRGDTMPICNEIIKTGWVAFPFFYSDEHFDLVSKLINQPCVQGVIIRVNPSVVQGVTNSKWQDLLDSFESKKMIMTLPTIMAKMGAKDSLIKVANLESGMKDTYAYYTIQEWNQKFMENLKKDPNQARVIKQNRGSSGEGIWIVKIKDPSQPVGINTVLSLTEAVDNHTEEQTVLQFTKFCHKYITGKDGLLVDQRFLPRIVQGQLRYNMILDEIVSIVHKIPVKGGISATLDSGATYISYPATEPKFQELNQQLKRDLPKMLQCFDMKNSPFPLIWTIDYIYGNKTSQGKDTFFIGEINCSCVGITSQLEQMAPKVGKAAVLCCEKKIKK